MAQRGEAIIDREGTQALMRSLKEGNLGGDTFNLTVNAGPGTNPAAVERAVRDGIAGAQARARNRA